MGSEHTPGPWSFCRIGARTGPVRMTNKTFVIHPVAGPRFAYLPEGRDDIQEANARLIAAAPDLLAVMPTIGHPGGRLLKVVAHYESGATQTIDGDVVTAAIAKAEGSGVAHV